MNIARIPGDDEVGRIASHPVHDGRIVHLSVDTVRFPDGSVGELEMIRHSGASAVLPLLGRRNEPDPDVLLIRQYRYASGGYMYEVPAGRPDAPGEDWELCARRELEEETGMVAGRMTRMTGIFTTPGFTDEFIHIYLAEDLREGSTSHDHDEFIEQARMPLSTALALVASGEITDGKTICSLLFASRFLLSPAEG
jgi:ADP-ribose pyrophosphatase